MSAANKEIQRLEDARDRLCCLLTDLSCQTWERIEFARLRPRMKIFETTITQNIIYEINRQSFSTIEIYEATNEAANGNDIELYLELDKGFIFLPLQAKILYKNNKYHKLDHGRQIHSLVEYAEDGKGIPLYILYNYTNNPVSLMKILCKKGDVKSYGCSLVPAEILMKNYITSYLIDGKVPIWKIPTFENLHPEIAIPWSMLACQSWKKQSKEEFVNLLFRNDESSKNDQIKLYARDDFMQEDSNWTSLDLANALRKKLNTIPKEPSHSNYIVAGDTYMPMFRIVLNAQEIINNKRL